MDKISDCMEKKIKHENWSVYLCIMTFYSLQGSSDNGFEKEFKFWLRF